MDFKLLNLLHGKNKIYKLERERERERNLNFRLKM